MLRYKQKIFFILSLCLTIILSLFLSDKYLLKIKFSENDISINMPSYNSQEYKKILNEEDIINTESSFKVLSKDNINIDINSNFVTNLRQFSEKYINTLKEDTNNAEYQNFFIKKENDTFDLIKNDFDINEHLFKIQKSDFQILNSTNGALEPNGANAYLDLEIQFTVEGYIDDNKITPQILEVGETYTQKRSLYLKRCENNEYKISEQFIGNFIKKTL